MCGRERKVDHKVDLPSPQSRPLTGSAPAGALPLNPAHLQRKDVIRLRDQNAEKPYFANYAIKVIRILMEHCIDLGWRSDNPAKGVSLLKVQTDPRLPWPPSLITAFRKAAPLGTRERLLMELCLGTGQRIGDVLKMRWSDIEDGGISVKQSKTGKHLWVPIVPALQEALDAATRQAIYILTNHHATNCWSYRGASQAIRNMRGDNNRRDRSHASTMLLGAIQCCLRNWSRGALQDGSGGRCYGAKSLQMVRCTHTTQADSASGGFERIGAKPPTKGASGL